MWALGLQRSLSESADLGTPMTSETYLLLRSVRCEMRGLGLHIATFSFAWMGRTVGLLCAWTAAPRWFSLVAASAAHHCCQSSP